MIWLGGIVALLYLVYLLIWGATEQYEWERYTLTDEEYNKLEKHLGPKR